MSEALDAITDPGRHRALLLVLDGLGVGAMPDAPAGARGANTLAHVVPPARRGDLPNLASLGLFDLWDGQAPPGATVAALGYAGADSYLGHNELLGGVAPETHPDTVRGTRSVLLAALRDVGFSVDTIADGGALWVDGGILVSDNLENEPGMAINLAGSLDVVDLATVYRAGAIVRQHVRNTRVIAFGSPNVDPAAILAAVHTTAEGQTGIVTPEVGFYHEGFQVRHLGIEFDARRQLPHLLLLAGHRVEMIGKMADVAIGDAQIPRRPVVETDGVLSDVSRTWARLDAGLVAATVQETDLSGHGEDAERFFQVLREVDEWLGTFLPSVSENDLFILTADHGDDPTLGSHHTREYVPVLTYGAAVGRLVPMPNLRGVAVLLARLFGVDSDGFGPDALASRQASTRPTGSVAESFMGIGPVALTDQCVAPARPSVEVAP